MAEHSAHAHVHAHAVAHGPAEPLDEAEFMASHRETYHRFLFFARWGCIVIAIIMALLFWHWY